MSEVENNESKYEAMDSVTMGDGSNYWYVKRTVTSQ
jgi:hypothetical protein